MTGHDGGRHLDRGCCVRSSVACVGLIRFRTSGEKANKGNCQEKREQAARRRDAVEQTFILQGKNHSPSFHISRFEQDRPTSEFHLVGCRSGRGGARPRRGPRRKGRWPRLAGAFLPKIACGENGRAACRERVCKYV